MPRRKRSYLPDCAFHITAVTHGGELWFDELRSEIVEIVALALERTDAVLLAYAIMSNHIHLVVRQGKAPLSQLMHPVCQRTAYAVHRRFKRSGYVMGYRYFDTPCGDESHLRNAILYTHRNPVEAGMCKDAGEYPWSSHSAYLSRGQSGIHVATLRPAVGLFGSGLPDRTPQQDYADFYKWYDACKNVGPDELRPQAPGLTAGDEFWLQNFGKKTAIVEEYFRRDLNVVVEQTLREQTPRITLRQLRAGGRTRSILEIRNVVIERALRAGHRPVNVARFLNTSDSTISRVNVALTRSRQT